MEIKRKEKESDENFIRRFGRVVQRSRKLADARKVRFCSKGKSKTERRDEALYKVEIRSKIDKLKKFGKFDDDALKEIKKKMNR